MNALLEYNCFDKKELYEILKKNNEEERQSKKAREDSGANQVEANVNLKIISNAAESSAVSFNHLVESRSRAAPAVAPMVLDTSSAARHAEEKSDLLLETRLKNLRIIRIFQDG